MMMGTDNGNAIAIIGGADGPTSIFLAGKIGTDIFDGLGLIFIILLMIPNILYAIKTDKKENLCTNKGMNLIEQIGRYGSIIFMVFHIGVINSGFSSITAFFAYVIGNILLLVLYWALWMLYFHKKTYRKQIALAIIPVCIFLLSGITAGNIPLIVSGILFGIGHIYVKRKNCIEEE